MPKLKTLYTCQNCTYQSTQWQGQCPQCGQWNTFVEEVVDTAIKTSKEGKRIGKKVEVVELSAVSSQPPKRLTSNISEFDRVLGGGFVAGQVILLSGEPGIGKSTILTEIARNLKEKKVLYVCGEENIEQIKVRTQRMNYKSNNLLLLPETNLESILDAMENTKDLSLVIVDSIQTLYSEQLSGFAGSLVQIKGCTQVLTDTAKRTKIPLVLVGHVTKQGVVAGPKVLEHVVDTVLYLEGDNQHMFRLLRTSKNRFGPVSEIGIFEMNEKGMTAVENPSELFLSQMLSKTTGSCVTVVMEGFRPLLFEVQALTVKTDFGYPKRTATGFNANRLQVLIALMEKRLRLNLKSYDVYLNVAGGFKISEYAADLAVCMAIASSVKDSPVKEKTVVFGECGLSGEIRRVSHQEKRIAEAKKLGYTNVISPENVKSLFDAMGKLF